MNIQQPSNNQIYAKTDKTQHSAAQQYDIEVHSQEKIRKKRADYQPYSDGDSACQGHAQRWAKHAVDAIKAVLSGGGFAAEPSVL